MPKPDEPHQSRWDRRGTFDATEGLIAQAFDAPPEMLPLRYTTLIVTIFVSAVTAGAAGAQSVGDRGAPEQGSACPPDVKGEPPTVGGGSSEPLSDKLADSKGVICPPSGVDREMQVAPPGGGRLKVIPPPGAPGGDQSVQPK